MIKNVLNGPTTNSFRSYIISVTSNAKLPTLANQSFSAYLSCYVVAHKPNYLKKILLITLLLPFIGTSQVNLDSLWSIWSDKNQADTTRLSAISSFVWDGYLFTQPDSAFYFSQLEFDFAESKGLKDQMGNALQTQGISFAVRNNYARAIDYFTQCLAIVEEIDDKQGIASSLSNIGNVYKIQGDFDSAIYFHSRSLSIAKDIGDKEVLAGVFTNLGILYRDQGNYAKAINYFTQSLTINEELKDKRGVSISLNHIGIIYKNQNDYVKALEYFERCMSIEKELSDKQGFALSLNNIGIIHKSKGNFTSALDFYSRSLNIMEEIGDKRGMANAMDNIGNIYNEQENLSEALLLYSKSLTIQKEMNDKQGIASSLWKMGEVYNKQRNYKKAIELCLDALTIAKEMGTLIETKHAANTLYEAYKNIGKEKQALEMFELYISMRDSIVNEKNQKEIIRQEYKYDYEKQAAEDSIKAREEAKVKDAQLTAEQAQNKQHQIEAKQQKQQAYFLYGGLGLALLFGGFIFNRFKVTNKQKLIIEVQKEKVDEAFDELEEKNQEIMDSINYAKRIQSAILPPSKVVKEYLQQSFILYKPKDIVAGDFYWLEHKDGKVLFAAADCTGHGVPGAMVSVICNNGLNRSVREHGLSDPGKILDKTREIVIQEFEKSEDEVKDGMDIALCSLEENKLQYAGAHNPLWIIRTSPDGGQDGVLTETKADKQPIGKFDKQTPYTTNTFNLEKGDSIYIFSDGYVDQFGGEKGKKFKSKAFKELLLSIQDKSMEEQRVLIDEAFETWRGSLEQIDDVCVIGVRI